MNSNISSQRQQNPKRIMNQFSADVIQKAISFQNRNQSMKRLHPKCKFSEEEDELLKNLVSEMLKSNDTNIDNDDVKNENLVNSAIDWNKVALSMKTSRNARQCRERYLNYLSPLVENGPWTPEEEELLCEKYNEIGPHWKQISVFFPSRTDINVKSHFHLIERRNMKAEKKRLKAIQKQEEIENLNKVNQPNIISNNLSYQTSQPIVNNSISNGLNYQSNQPVINSAVPSLPLQFAPVPSTFYSNKASQIKETVNEQQQQKNNSEQNAANGEENICESPLPFFSFLAQEVEKEFESNSNECWNSLLMNDEANEAEIFLDKWF